MNSAEFAERAGRVKLRLLGMLKAANAGHVGPCLSCAELLVHLRFAWMGPDDTLVFSKGHAAPLLYAVLAEAGVLPESELAEFDRDGGRLAAHPHADAALGIPFATGSLGHGLGLAAGLALGARLRGEARRVFCVTSDGELDEGSTWEAAMFIAHHGLANLVWLIDRNGLQAFGRTEDVLGLEPLHTKLDAFGFAVHETNGHSFRGLERARRACAVRTGKPRPNAVICRTVKGRGLRGLEGTVDSHYLPLTDAQYRAACGALRAGRPPRRRRRPA